MRTPHASSVVPWVAWIAAFGTAVGYVLKFGPDLPYEDEFGQLWQLVGEEPVTLSWLFAPVSEHRVPLSRLAWLGALRAADFDFRAGMLLNVALLAGLAALLLRAMRSAHGGTSVADAFLPILILSLGQHENLLWSMQVLFILPAVLFGIFLAAVCGMSDADPPPLATGIAVALLPLVDASGLVLSLPLAAWLLAEGIGRARRRQPRSAAVLALAAVSALVSAVFLLTLEKPDNVPDYDASLMPRGALEVIGGSLGPASVSTPLRNRLWALLVCVLTLWALSLLLRARTRGTNARSDGLAACLVAPLGLFLAIGYARGALGPGACLLTKYSTLSATLLVAIYVVSRLHGGRAGRLVAFGLFGVALLAQNAGIRQAWRYGETRRRGYDAFAADVARGLTADAIVARNRKTLYAEITPEMFEWMRGLQRHRIGPFEEHRARLDRDVAPRVEEDVPVTPIRWNDLVWNDGVARITGGDPYLVFRLDRPRDVLAVRLAFFTATERRPETRLELFWALSGSPQAEFDWWERSVNATVPPTPGRRVLELPIYDTVDLLRLDPEALANEFRLERLTLLLRAPG